MKIARIGLLGLGALAGVMVFTNPKPEDYTAFAADTLTQTMADNICRAETLDEWLGKVGQSLGETCELSLHSGRRLRAADIEGILLSSTEISNYGLFTIYQTTTPTHTYKAIGLLNRFILL